MADVRVKDVMTRSVVTLEPEDSIHEAARRLASHHISGAPVVDGDEVVGMVTESDLIHSAAPPVPVDRGPSVFDVITVMATARPHGRRRGLVVREIMSPFVVWISSEDSIWRAADVMDRKGIKRLPVLSKDGALVGVISRADLVRAMARDDEQIGRDVIESIGILGSDAFEGLDVRVEEGLATVEGIADRMSTHKLAVKLASRTPGVVGVVDHMTHRIDDAKSLPRRSRAEKLDPRHNWQERLDSR